MRLVPILRRAAVFTATIAAVVAASCSSCGRSPAVSDAVYREAVTAFHTGIAALETSQEVLARQKLDRVVALVPQEAAGWANLGLLLLRQQETELAHENLVRAAGLAPSSPAIARLLALAESRRGNVAQSIRHWRRALELDPGDVKAAYALAQEVERQGSAEFDAEAALVLDTLLARTDNLPARLDAARLAAKRGDAEALQAALAPLVAAAPGWPEAARAQLQALQQAAASDPRSAATRVVFLKNVLVREPAYRRALAQVTTPLDAIGEPIERFLVLDNPTPQPAPADTALAWTIEPVANQPPNVAWAGAFIRSGSAAPVAAFATDAELRLGDQVVPGSGTTAPGASALDAVLAADLDYDYRTDLVLAGALGLRLLRAGEHSGFTDVTRAAAIPRDLVGAPAHGAWAADVDTDGDLDIVLAPVAGPPLVLRNNGDRTFAVRRPFNDAPSARGLVWADLDDEGVPDATFVDAAGAVHVFLNVRGGDFVTQTVPVVPQRVAAIDAADVDANGTIDLVTLGVDGQIGSLTRDHDGRWRWASLARIDSPPAGLEPGVSRLIVADLDNNGAADLVASGAHGARVLLATGPRAFHALAAPLDADVRAATDLDGDGRLDLIGVTSDRRAAVIKVRGFKSYHWQTLRARSASATGDQRINSFGIGGVVEVRAGLQVQTRTIASPLVHVGLGEAVGSDVIRIVWPNGVLQSEFERPADASVAADQRLKGSCPWLFAWNGREMAFVTDLIWRSPLGLRLNAQQAAAVATTEDWVKVSGQQLAPRDGAYDLRVTAELWETHFFDLVSLMVVDHPPDTEVFIDERFAVPPPALQPIVTGPVQPLAARDDRGADVTAVVRTRDDRHLDFAGRGAYQGVTRPHFVELELPDEAPRRGPLWLVAQGWVHPTDSSINVALGQGSHQAPRGLSLLVADASGRFTEARANLGFPSGKDKTVLLDLTGLLPQQGPRRLRLSTNLEIFWDRLGWAAGRPDVRVEPRRLELRSADLRYRGYSVTSQTAASSPERPRYVLAGTAPRWLDLTGYHTRFGDVRPLLAGVDDRYVIMNAGDELALRFTEAPAPAPGHTRDFIVVGDGWVKDGDFNTSFSRTVLPLPTHASPRYDRAPTRLEDDPVYQRHRDDFAVYHTRYVTPDRARHALRPGGTPVQP